MVWFDSMLRKLGEYSETLGTQKQPKLMQNDFNKIKWYSKENLNTINLCKNSYSDALQALVNMGKLFRYSGYPKIAKCKPNWPKIAIIRKNEIFQSTKTAKLYAKGFILILSYNKENVQILWLRKKITKKSLH